MNEVVTAYYSSILITPSGRYQNFNKKQQMSQFKKIYCAYHQKEFITNFCIEPNCILPLCPQCICSHNQFHNQHKTQATYSSINDVLSHSAGSMKSLIQSFQYEHQRMNTLIPIVSDIPDILVQKLKIVKSLAIKEIELAFDNIQKQMLLKLGAKQEFVLGPNCAHIQDTLKLISSSITSLNRRLKSLKGQKCLSSVIKFIQKQHQKYRFAKNQITQKISDLQSLEFNIKIDEQIIEHIAPLLKRFISIQFDKNENSFKSQTRTFQEPLQQFVLPSKQIIIPKLNGQYFKLVDLADDETGVPLSTRRQKQSRFCDQQLQSISQKIIKLRKNYQDIGGVLDKI